jgi:small-conductance mechanosensitive channel
MKGDKRKARKQAIKEVLKDAPKAVLPNDITQLKRELRDINRTTRAIEYYQKFLEVHEAEQKLYTEKVNQLTKQIAGTENAADALTLTLNKLEAESEKLERERRAIAARHIIQEMRDELLIHKLNVHAICAQKKEKFDLLQKAINEELVRVEVEVNQWLKS